MEPAVLHRLRRRDPGAMESAVRAHGADVLHAAMALGLREDEAEELAAETFAAFLDAAPRFEGRSTVRTFLLGILYRKALERGRERAKERASDPIDEVFESRFNLMGHWSRPPAGPEEETLTHEVSEMISECLEELKPLQKAVFLLKEFEGESNQAICNALRLSDTHLRVLLFRARNKLRERLEQRWWRR